MPFEPAAIYRALTRPSVTERSIESEKGEREKESGEEESEKDTRGGTRDSLNVSPSRGAPTYDQIADK